MIKVDLNCDMGEGTGNDNAIMPYISSANIACGYHAGDVHSIRATIQLAIQYNVAVGAHISYADKENFGRNEMHLPVAAIYELVEKQLQLFYEVAAELNIRPVHVKPHGALYNMAAKDPVLAQAIATAISKFDSNLILFALSGSSLIDAGSDASLATCNEVFADRTYQDDGSLTARTNPAALITETDVSIRQVDQMVKRKEVTSLSGKLVPVKADTICIHGDGIHAPEFAQAINTALRQRGIEICSPATEKCL